MLFAGCRLGLLFIVFGFWCDFALCYCWLVVVVVLVCVYLAFRVLGFGFCGFLVCGGWGGLVGFGICDLRGGFVWIDCWWFVWLVCVGSWVWDFLRAFSGWLLCIGVVVFGCVSWASCRLVWRRFLAAGVCGWLHSIARVVCGWCCWFG